MKIEAGKYYRTRDGRKVGPILWREFEFISIEDAGYWEDSKGSSWYENGNRTYMEQTSGGDLIAEWTDVDAVEAPAKPSPFVVRRELVPGTYGIVSVVVVGDSIDVDVEHDGLTEEQAIEAAHLFTQLAEYLRETK